MPTANVNASATPAEAGGGEILVRQLELHGVDTVFMVPGESFLPCIDALGIRQERVRTVTCRQEGGAAYAAEAYGKLTGKPGVCFVTRGPGATNASIGLHVAHQDGTPMILFVGQIGSDTTERACFQEVDYRQMFGPVAKWVAQIDRTDRIPEFVARAFAESRSGRPGPVVLALPEDTLWGNAAVADVHPFERAHPRPAVDELDRLADLLGKAKRPFVIAGGTGWTNAARADLAAFAERFDLPVGVSWRRQEVFDNRHPNFAGHVGYGTDRALAARIAEADLLISVCSRLDEPTTEGYTLVESPLPRQTLVHIHPDGNELGRVYRPALAVNADPVGAAAALAEMRPAAPLNWSGLAKSANEDYQRSRIAPGSDSALDMSRVCLHMADVLPDDAFVSVGAGNFALFPHRFMQFSHLGTQASPICGSMGYGLPAAIAAKLAFPEREAIAFAGDGCFQMTIQEIGTAVQHRLGIVILVCNNQAWGTIRAHQARDYPARPFALTLENPDFAALARSYGASGEIVEKTEEFAAAFQRARQFAKENQRPALIELRYDVEYITPDTRLSEITAAAQAANA
ncbi:thiamine pyrophosphate-binding protein [Falsochrobactrum sp. TDYN1]|uniref:Thiamine pyrophosphate-binding protein n=1 Tax=Falsochrobactrum tianjinense TaxID=2706015 RepID=A0A949UUD6_9HYPH|nr:thiamine pyrophosphate-binding protein [Falsochrobactrum sp. TDYN1]MBV2143682.1 thiamine pyrophosphate-binding protein [Falsochrobactrum sp. TDYN1]